MTQNEKLGREPLALSRQIDLKAKGKRKKRSVSHVKETGHGHGSQRKRNSKCI